jgi:hypothetical protein
VVLHFFLVVLTSILNPSVYFETDPSGRVVTMESQSQGHRPFSTFSAGIGMGPNTFTAYHYPSREIPQDNFQNVNIHNFADDIPTEDPRPDRITTRQLHHEIDTGHTDHTKTQRRSLTKSLFLPTLILTTPIALLAAALLVLVFAYKAQTDPDLFPTADKANQASTSYILVDFSATRLVFVASFLSSTAPLLTSFVMILWTLPVAHSLRQASLEQNYAQLPTPYQLSLVIGLTLASYERLWRYLAYLFSPSRAQIPRVVHRAAGVLIVTTFLALAVFGSDAALHFTTTTVPFDQLKDTLTPTLQYGRGLSEYCLTLNRLQNYGLPCSYNYIETDPNAVEESNESFRLAQNNSKISELLVVQDRTLTRGDMVVLTPAANTVDSEVNYKASTIGVSSQCYPITTRCNMRSDTANEYHTLFNCTDQFWGVLGAAPNASQTFTKAIDANVPGLAYKPAANLQYGFFNDSQLTLPYNTIGYNSSGDSVYPPLTDAELINPIYSAFAGRIGWSSESAGSQLNSDKEIFLPIDDQVFADFVLNCTITSYEVNLTFANGSVRAMEFEPTKNGSLLEIFHGIQFYVDFQTGDPGLQDYLNQVALQNTSEALAKAWGNLYSQNILSTIGGYTSPRMNLEEQQRKSLLVASVSKPALGALIACSLTYTVLGIVLCIVALRSSATEVRDLAAQLSLAGLVTSVFGDQTASPSSAGTGSGGGGGGGIYDQRLIRQEKQPIGVDVNGNQSFDFRTWV